MTFPIACYVVKRSALGEDELTSTMTKAGNDLNDAIVTAVLKQAAFSVGVQVALMCIPVFGWAIAGLLSVTQMIVGTYYQKKMESVIDQTMEDIKARGEATEARVMSVLHMVKTQEFPAARLLAMGNQDLGSFWDAPFKSVAKVVKAVPKQVVHLVRSPSSQMKFLTTLSPVGIARIGVKAVMSGAVGVAKLAESTNIIGKGDWSAPVQKARTDTDDMMFSAQKLTHPLTAVQEGAGLTAKWGGQAVAVVLEATGNEKGAAEARNIGNKIHGQSQEYMNVFTPTGSYNLLSGREGMLAAQDACDSMRAQSFATMDKLAQEGIAKIQSEEGRKAVRTAIAKALRADPAFMAQVQELRDLEERERMKIADSETELRTIIGPPAAKSGAGAVVGIAAAAAAALAFSS